MSSNAKIVVRSSVTMSYENAAYEGDDPDAALDPPMSPDDPDVEFQAYFETVSSAVAPTADIADPNVASVMEGNATVEQSSLTGTVSAHFEVIENGIEHVEFEERYEKWTSRKWTQHLAAILATLSSLSVGYVDGWSANAVPFFKSSYNDSVSGNTTHHENVLWNDDIKPIHDLTDQQAAWICSMVALGAMLGSLPSGLLANIFGRKSTLIGLTFPCTMSWIIVLFACDSLNWIYGSRFMAGTVMGVASAVVPLYIEEISEVSVRGALGVYQNMMVSVGILTAYVAGATMPFFWTSLFPCFFPLAVVLFFTLMPESPVFLLIKGREAEAKNALRFLRGSWMNMRDEVARLRPQVDRVRRTAEDNVGWRPSQLLKWNPSRLGILISLMLMLARQFTGINAVSFYAVEIFQSTHSSVSPIYCTIIIGVVEVLATFVACGFVDKFGRRPLLLQSGIFMTVSHYSLALYFHFMNIGYDVSALSSWLPISLLCLFIVTYSVGFGPLPWFMMAELIPTEDKRWATGAASFLNWVGMFVVLQMFPLISSHVGRQASFVFFGTCCLLATIAVAAIVPETKGKSLDEIQRNIENKRNVATE